MSLTVSNSGGASYDPVSAGTHLAVCNLIVDLGLQYSERFKKSTQKVLIGWEIADEVTVVDDEERPKTKTNTYTASLNESSNLRRDLAAWRGRDFTESELEGFNLNNILGKCCLLTIIHKESNGKTYANIQSVSALPKGMPKAQLSSPPVTFDFDTDSLDKIKTLPDWIQDILYKSKTYEEKMNANVDQPAGQSEFTELNDDGELPF